MLAFHIITLVILYIPVSQSIKWRERERERERERVNVNKSMKLALILGAYNLNFLTTLSKLDISQLGFLKDMFIYIFNLCK